jgi:hypothetical protein
MGTVPSIFMMYGLRRRTPLQKSLIFPESEFFKQAVLISLLSIWGS